MIFTIEETKEFFRNNKEIIKGKSVVFRWGGNQEKKSTLREIGEKILELQNKGSHFSIGQIWFEKKEKSREIHGIGESLEEFILQLENNEISSFDLNPHTPQTHDEMMSSGAFGSLD